jgi:single-strand DNA-binding protein
MAGSVNKVILVGNVGKDPETKNFDNGGKIVKFTMATTESYKNRAGEKVENTEWHNIIVSRKGLNDIAEKYIVKGSKLYVEGSLKTRSWEQNGEKKYMTEIVVDNMTMLGKAGAGSSQKTEPKPEPKPEPQKSIVDDESDLPF